MSSQNWIELFGAVFGIAGTWLLSENNRWSGWGFVVFLASNAAWIWFSIDQGHWFLLAQYIGLTIFSARGAWRYLVRPPASADEAPATLGARPRSQP